MAQNARKPQADRDMRYPLYRRLYEHQSNCSMSCAALSNLDSGSEQWFRQRRIGRRARRGGWSEHHARADDSSRKHESSPRQRGADSRHCCAHAGYRSPDSRNRQSQPWNGSQHQRLYTAIAEWHAGHNFTGVGNSWSYHPATRAASAQQSATKQWHKWEPGATFELVESGRRSSVQGVPLFCPNNSELLHKLQNDSDYACFGLKLPSPDYDIALVLVPG
jgi:hypothetical protein